ncbi:MAG: hypothetical protein HMLIMOIP_000550 [Candidatus Nitrosomirales archaeon]|jgi:hypothetical protein
MSAPTSDPVLEFVIDLFGVLIGAFLGFVFGILFEKWKKSKETRELKHQTVSSLIKELKYMQNSFKDSHLGVKWDDGKHLFEGDSVFMTAPASKNAIDTGNIRLLPIDAQVKLDNFYITVERCNDVANQVEKFYMTPMFTHNNAHIIAERLAKQLEWHYNELRKTIDDLLLSLESKE